MVLHLAQSTACSLPAWILLSLRLYFVSCLRGYLPVRTLSIIYGSISQAYRPKACTRIAVKELFTFETPAFFYRWSLVSPVFYPVTKIIPKPVIGLHKLYIEEKLLHRDISIRSLAYEEVDRMPRIINLELELSTRVQHEARPIKVSTGTAPFMSRDVLKGFESGYRHTLNHDLESVYYIAGWHIAGYRGYELPAINNVKPDPFRRWKYGTYEEMLQAKEKHMSLSAYVDFFDVTEFDEANEVIYDINGVRHSYRKRLTFCSKREVEEESKKEMAIKAVKIQAYQDRLPKEERMMLVRKKKKELEKEIKLCRATSAVSFKEWMIGAELVDPKGIDCDCDSCNDEFAKSQSISGKGGINE